MRTRILEMIWNIVGELDGEPPCTEGTELIPLLDIPGEVMPMEEENEDEEEEENCPLKNP